MDIIIIIIKVHYAPKNALILIFKSFLFLVPCYMFLKTLLILPLPELSFAFVAFW
jgi:hypothetical protein